MSKIYIACPSYVSSGGPEALHQLAFKLKYNYNVEVYIFYFDYNPNLNRSPVNPSFIEYVGKNWVASLTETKTDYLIVPEGYSELFGRYFIIKKVVWWLSIDNYFKSYNANLLQSNHLGHTLRSKFGLLYQLTSLFYRKKIYFHFAQSYYAYCYLKKFRINNLSYLSDYINSSYIKNCNCCNEKKNIVLYNPAKGFDFTQQLINFDNTILWIPLRNLDLTEIQTLMQSAKLYVDFGGHPGKDRLPREAIICGCLLLTGNDGAAKNRFDIPIGSQYKFKKDKSNIPVIIESIHSIMNNYEIHKNEFEKYRKIILDQEFVFENEVENFVNILIKNSK